MPTFAAQLKTSDTDLDVSITLSNRNVQIATAKDHLGVWSTRDCTFERLARRAYRVRLGEEDIHLRVVDDRGFRRAIGLIREEQGSLIPPPLLWIGLSAVVAAVVAGMVMGGEPPAEAQPTPSTRPATVPATTIPSAPVNEGTSSSAAPVRATDIVDRWNDLAGASTLRLDGAGVNELADATVTVEDTGIQVDAVPTGSAANAERIMAALGIAIGSADPSLEPSERAAVLERLGLRVNAPNLDPLESGISHNGVGYHLSFEPGTKVGFRAGLEW